MTISRLIIAIIILLIAAYIVVMNWGCIFASMRNRWKGIDKHHSTVPVVSLILAGIAFTAYPYTPKMWIGIIPLVDIANWSMLWLPVVLIKEAGEKKRSAEPSDALDKK